MHGYPKEIALLVRLGEKDVEAKTANGPEGHARIEPL